MQRKTIYTSRAEFNALLFDYKNTSNAYVMKRSKANAALTRINRILPTFRIMKESMECGLVSYSMPRASSFRASINVAVQSVLEAGLFGLYEQWMLHYLRVAFDPLKLITTADISDGFVVVSWLTISGVFYMYIVGVGLAMISFGMELFCKVYLRKRKNWIVIQLSKVFVICSKYLFPMPQFITKISLKGAMKMHHLWDSLWD